MKSPASGASNVSKPRLLPQDGGGGGEGESGGARSRVRVDHCFHAIGEAEVPVSSCLRSSLYHVTETERPLRL
jgi:hypothetical protein